MSTIHQTCPCCGEYHAGSACRTDRARCAVATGSVATPEQIQWLAKYRRATGLDPTEYQEWLRGEVAFEQMRASAVKAIRLMLAEIE